MHGPGSRRTRFAMHSMKKPELDGAFLNRGG